MSSIESVRNSVLLLFQRNLYTNCYTATNVTLYNPSDAGKPIILSVN